MPGSSPGHDRERARPVQRFAKNVAQRCTDPHSAPGMTVKKQRPYAAACGTTIWRTVATDASLSNPALISSSRIVRSISLSTGRSEEHTSELQSLLRISYARFCLKKKKSH